MVRANGVDLSLTDEGRGPAVLMLHETAATAAVWAPLSEALSGGMRAIAHDRRGWGRSEAPAGYTATSVEEQAEDAAALLAALGVESAVLCGSGLGAVAALDLVLRGDPLVTGAVLIEPPLLALLPEATEGLSSDRAAIESALREGGLAAAADLYRAGGLAHLGAGAGRIPAEISAAARDRPRTLFAELGAVPSWSLRLERMEANRVPCLLVTSPSTPEVLSRAAERLGERLRAAEPAEVGGEGLPQIGGVGDLAGLLRSLAGL
ncbi:MAG: alpha/beta hydrolase [Solirubrobacterales bacterium]